MRLFRGLAAMMLVAGAASVPAVAVERAIVADGSTRPAPVRRRRALASAPMRYRRSRNAPHRRRLRANRLHVSRRVRRRHRRAA